MIKNIEDIRELGYNQALHFLENCKVYEKLDMFYFKMKVVSKTSVIFYKANNKEIKIEDIILASMWKEPIELLSKVFLSNQEILQKFVGYTFGMFYLPCEKPLKVSYSGFFKTNKAKYIISDIFDPKGKKKSENDYEIRTSLINAFKDIPQVWPFGIEVFSNEKLTFNKKAFKRVFYSKDSLAQLIWHGLGNGKETLQDQMFLSDDIPEGIILKNGYKLYQFSLREPYTPKEYSKIAMEVILTEFCKWSLENEYNEMITSNYVETVCNLFEGFMSNADFSLYNISAEELEAPTFGYYSGMCFDYIPSKRTKELCEESKFNENVFKILLNGLRRQKLKDSYQFLTNQYKDVWNGIVKLIQTSTMSNFTPLWNK